MIRLAVRSLPADERWRLLRDFWGWANETQKPPEAPWRIWLFAGGRGAGKTRAGAEFVTSMVAMGRARRVGLIGGTLSEALSVMVEGPSGLMQVRGRRRRPKLVASRRKLVWPNGAEASWFSAEKPGQLRGPEFDLIWADEFAKWRRPMEVFDVVQFALRQGTNPRMMITTTPQNAGPLLAVQAGKGVVTTNAATMVNRRNLSPDFVRAMEEKYDGTLLGRQELYGEILAHPEGHLFKRAWFDAARVSEAPVMTRVVVAVDPAVTAKKRSDACGIVAVGLGEDGCAYVLGDHTVRGLTPVSWAARVAAAAEDHGAATVVAETNQGGDFVTGALKDAAPDLRVKGVTAQKSKRARAEAFAVAYERGRVRHVGRLDALEDEMCLFGVKDAPSPDRMDALVWALSELLPPKPPAMPRVWLAGF
jgi:phage terminase large subunit-like protein